MLTLLILVSERIIRFFLSAFLGYIPFYCYFGDQFANGFSTSKKNYTDAEKDYERDAIELITSRGYPVEEHFVTTPDGFILGLHRITGPKLFNTPPDSPPTSPRDLSSGNGANTIIDDIREANSNSGNRPSSTTTTSSNSSSTSLSQSNRPVVLIMHGFMQTSEAWLCRSNPEDSLPFILADAGFDVWLGNNRGNKYSFKHTKYAPNQEGFWNWSLDELVRYDFPSIVDFITDRTQARSITYIGFSQGTAQGWATLSTNTNIAKKINLFIALAPVSTVKGFSNPMIDSLARSRPDFIFLLFGKKSMLPSTIFWRNILPKNVFVNLIDQSVGFLFGWHTENINEEEKAMLYSHIFSYTSVKSVVHWFQIIQTNRFQMFDDMLLGKTPNENSNKHNYHGRVIPGYHPSQVLTKCALFYGGADNLPNTKALLSHIPRDKLVMVHEEEKYEHLDFMWGKDANKKIFSKIVNLINSLD
ncbi:carboxylic ester hydrolase [Tieghemostelium lacteum]|uniref:Carboxylic ester hydrolase n=1 Tax=Tieghemostelium lacteum TaxID=361077 RepID=A0A151Z637_TIELA|nr:carboxylic ester hydrolase [Tieghemostelium lacteum]|eukprot:KYQ89423.1 carboxylic ester hydrolase [Tieghemostelium lacteum]